MTGEGLSTVIFPPIFLQVFQTRLVFLYSKAVFFPIFLVSTHLVHISNEPELFPVLEP